jgi:MoaA/NifB/PqqE/SkfB family radical SAM enzyme
MYGLTFIVPAPDGCNLACPNCFIDQRREAKEMVLKPQDLARFIEEAGSREEIKFIAMPGHEPLLVASLPYTSAVLETGARLNIPTTLVTNGIRLEEATDVLKMLAPRSIAVSLDSSVPEIHDKLRGRDGALETSIRGIKHAVDRLPDVHFWVNSIITPSRLHYLEGMPRLLSEIGVRGWIVNPLLKRVHDGKLRPVMDREKLFEGCLALKREAERYGIEFILDDTFNHLDYASLYRLRPEFEEISVKVLEEGVELVRLSPNGQCAVGIAMNSEITPDVPQWKPGIIHAADFLSSLPRS